MSTNTLKNLPWGQLEKGQGFFIPALDLDAVKEAGLRAAVQHHLRDAAAVYCVSRGRLGVYFYRRSPALRKRFESSTAAGR